ncbi:autotransporter assembly complex protein TamA [Massilia horti]|uniref:autotransporter assembly complex protein TamA n=1 Tax=Massilia horti TaxID=2562153 RepID=UPI001E4CE773|nr:autotransporter assembly complex family protein [Massilia horti]
MSQIVLAVYALLSGPVASAQETPPKAAAPAPLKYRVEIHAPRPLDKLLEQNLDLMRWRGDPRIDLEQLRHLVKVAPEQVKTLVATEGYYSPTVDAVLVTGGPVPVARVTVQPGLPVEVGDVDIELRGFVLTNKSEAPVDTAKLKSSWMLPVGSRFRQSDWEAAKRGLLREIIQSRFPLAELAETQAVVDPEKRRANLKVVVDSGPEVHFDGLNIVGLERYPQSVITNLNKIRPGDQYSEAALQAFQARLQDTGYFSSVEVSADMTAALNEQLGELAGQEQPPAAGPPAPRVVPVLVRVTENKRRNVSLGLGYSTNTGARGQVNYDNLNVFGKRMKSHVIYEQRRQSARADFFWPTTPGGHNNSIGGGYERSNLNGQLSRTVGLAASRTWGSPLLERTLTLEVLTEQLTIADVGTSYSKSMPLTYSVTRRALDSLVLPTRGFIVNGQLGIAPLPILTDEKFVRAYGRFLTYYPVGTSGTLVLRGELGAVGSKEKAGIPSKFLFRAGGDQSVRGYAYQDLGVMEGEAIVGARYLMTGSVEYDWWVRPPWGIAAFYDFGNAADTLHDLRPKVGYGLGARWRSPVGPIGIDVAYGKSAHQVRLHFSIGFTF